jgi:hypothetical protein
MERNPVRANLATTPSGYHGSRARARQKGKDDGLVRVSPLLEVAENWL